MKTLVLLAYVMPFYLSGNYEGCELSNRTVNHQIEESECVDLIKSGKKVEVEVTPNREPAMVRNDVLRMEARSLRGGSLPSIR